MTDDEIGAATGVLQIRIRIANSRRDQFLDHHFRAALRIHHALDDVDLARIDVGPQAMKEEALTFDERAIVRATTR